MVIIRPRLYDEDTMATITALTANLIPDVSNELFNLPIKFSINRSSVYAAIINAYASGRKLRILEIGVFKAGLIQGIFKEVPDIVESYTGIDPYLGTEDDPYFKSYWKSDGKMAESQYEESRDIFEKLGGVIIRKTSDAFFRKNTEKFDVIIVDGDHRVGPAMRDLHNSLRALQPGGLLLCDDYGNSDTPEVTRAVVRFVEEAEDFYDASGFRPIWFQNGKKPAPIQLSVVYWRKKQVAKKKRAEVI